ncbi:hypothetical protein BDR07DRAFT_934506 [Suillus spraguei]|nr:hypothetical protein BDR07DRAFT_934506 [Suillus spraguei]
MESSCPAEILHMLVLLLFLAFLSAVFCLRWSQQYADLSLTSTCEHGSLFSQVPMSLGGQIYTGIFQYFLLVQYFVLGPRLILSVREYHAELVANSDAATGMASIAFQEGVHVVTSSKGKHVWNSTGGNRI